MNKRRQELRKARTSRIFVFKRHSRGEEPAKETWVWTVNCTLWRRHLPRRVKYWNLPREGQTSKEVPGSGSWNFLTDSSISAEPQGIASGGRKFSLFSNGCWPKTGEWSPTLMIKLLLFPDMWPSIWQVMWPHQTHQLTRVSASWEKEACTW